MRFTRLTVFLVAMVAAACTAEMPNSPGNLQTQSLPSLTSFGSGFPGGFGSLPTAGMGSLSSITSNPGPGLTGLTPGPSLTGLTPGPSMTGMTPGTSVGGIVNVGGSGLGGLGMGPGVAGITPGFGAPSF
jgi:hypothetical protein